MGAATRHAWTEQFGVGTPFGSEVPLSKWGIGLRVHDQAGYGIMDLHYNRLWESYERQQTIQEWSGLLIPTVAVRAFSMGIAGTDFHEHRAFSTAAEQLRRRMQDILSEDLVEHADGHGEAHFTYRSARDLWAKVPAFRYQPASALTSLQRNLRSLAMLWAGLFIAALCASAAILRRRSW
jgi:ABC-2 type transport system permease protein